MGGGDAIPPVIGVVRSVGERAWLKGGRVVCLIPSSPTKLDKIENLHSTDTIDTENSGTRGRPVWVHSRLLDSSVPAEEGGAVGNGVARSLGAEPGYAVRS